MHASVNIGMVFDNRYHHDHYYPARGYLAPSLPGGALVADGSAVSTPKPAIHWLGISVRICSGSSLFARNTTRPD